MNDDIFKALIIQVNISVNIFSKSIARNVILLYVKILSPRNKVVKPYTQFYF